MSGKKIGYIRVSSLDQNKERQLSGIKLDKSFVDKASGANISRPALKEMLNYVRDGDEVIVHSMDRLARNLIDLRKIVEDLVTQKVKITFVKENLTFTGDDTPMSKLLLSVLGAVAEFGRELIKENQREGIELAKKRGVFKGRKPALSEEQIVEIENRVLLGDKKSEIARDFNVCRETIYKHLRKRKSFILDNEFEKVIIKLAEETN